MGIPTEERASIIANDIVNVATRLKFQAASWKTVAHGAHGADWVVNDLLPDIRDKLNTLRPDTAWSVNLKTKIAAYATDAIENPPVDWWAEYNVTRDALIVVRNRAVNDATGSGYTVEASGAVTWETLPGNTALANGLQALINAID